MTLLAQLSGLAQKMVPHGPHGKAYMIVPVSSGAGASTITAHLARLSAQSSQRPVWLFDLDFVRNGQADRAPLNGQMLAGDFNGSAFWRCYPEESGRLAMRRIEGLPVFVSQFQQGSTPVRSVSIRRNRHYWQEVRGASALSLVDIPYGSHALKALCPDMDGVILVADARQSTRSQAEKLADRVELLGGKVLGVVVNRAPLDA